MTLSLAAAPGLPQAAQHLRTFVWNDPDAYRSLLDAAGSFAVKLTVAVLILAVTLWAAQWASKIVARSIHRLQVKRGGDRTLEGFAASMTRYTIVIVGLVAVLQQLGVRTTSIIAVLGAASLAIGLAMQGTLSNVAAGVMLLLFRPYRVGDDVEIAGRRGKVRALDLFATELSDPDNVRLVVPNSKAFGDVITNFSKPALRRIQLPFSIDYDDDIDKALALLIDCAKADDRIVADPEPWSRLTDLGESSVEVTLRAWVMPADYWNTRFDMIKRVKETFEGHGLRFPYPHQIDFSRKEFLGLDAAAKPEPAPAPAPRAKRRRSTKKA